MEYRRRKNWALWAVVIQIMIFWIMLQYVHITLVPRLN